MNRLAAASASALAAFTLAVPARAIKTPAPADYFTCNAAAEVQARFTTLGEATLAYYSRDQGIWSWPCIPRLSGNIPDPDTFYFLDADDRQVRWCARTDRFGTFIFKTPPTPEGHVTPSAITDDGELILYPTAHDDKGECNPQV
jgi:hypothetical protein